MKDRYYDLTGEDIDAYLAEKRKPAPTDDQIVDDVMAQSAALVASLNLDPHDASFAMQIGANLIKQVQHLVAGAKATAYVSDYRGVLMATFALALQALHTIDQGLDKQEQGAR